MMLEAKSGPLKRVEAHRIAGACIGEYPAIARSSSDPFDVGDGYGAALCKHVRRTKDAYCQPNSQIDEVLTHGVSVARENAHG